MIRDKKSNIWFALKYLSVNNSQSKYAMSVFVHTIKQKKLLSYSYIELCNINFSFKVCPVRICAHSLMDIFLEQMKLWSSNLSDVI